MTVEIAFIDEADQHLESRFFPSKVGGPPAWLDLKFIPSTAEMVCHLCGLPRQFLCQLYSPVEEKDTAFHRTLFVFVCLSEKCFQLSSNKNFIVFRNQLSLKNMYYPETAHGIESRTDIECSKFGTALCNICGIRASLNCRQCNDHFCTEHHLKLHDKHKSVGNEECRRNVHSLLPEFALNYEPEDLSNNSSDDSNSEEEEEEFSNPDNVAQISQKLTQFSSFQDDAALEEIFETCSKTFKDNSFLKFKSRIAHYPDQVLRYCRNGPLWLSDQNQPSANSIPSCEYCGSTREFEFQILPQLLNYLKIDRGEKLAPGILDWGTLAVYTCKNSCDNGPPYKKEFVWKQDFM